jgi:hypothetical protein
VRDRDAKNGTWLGQTRLPQDRDAPWKPGHVLQIGRTAIALQEPVTETLAEIEAAPDEPLPPEEPVEPPPPTLVAGAKADKPSKSAGTVPSPVRETSPPSVAPLASIPDGPAAAPARKRSGWTATDLTVMAAAIGVLALSIAGLYWLLRG